MAKKPNYQKIMKTKWTSNSKTNTVISLVVIVLLAFVIPKFTENKTNTSTTNNALDSNQVAKITTGDTDLETSLKKLTYTGEQIVSVNNGDPGFTKDELSLAKGSHQEYGDLDQLNRVTIAKAMLGKDLMPTTERERLYVNPTGYKNKRIMINGHEDWLYNRCHMIGYQLTGQNNNLKNLFTGTRSLNDPGMTKYENEIAQYLKSTNNHVYYVVQPIFVGDELVPRGVSMRAQSVENSEIKFNIYIFNVQTGYTINYQNGTSKKG